MLYSEYILKYMLYSEYILKYMLYSEYILKYMLYSEYNNKLTLKIVPGNSFVLKRNNLYFCTELNIVKYYSFVSLNVITDTLCLFK